MSTSTPTNIQEMPPGVSGSSGLHLQDLVPPIGGILKVLEDAFAGKLPILADPFEQDKLDGTLLGTVTSDLAKRLTTASIQFGVTADIAEDEQSANKYNFKCCDILGYLGWRLICADVPSCAGKHTVIGGGWKVYQLPADCPEELPVLVDYVPEPLSRAAAFVNIFPVILSGGGDMLMLAAAPLKPVANGEEVIGTIGDHRFRHIVDLLSAMMAERKSFETDDVAVNRTAYYEAMITCLTSIIEVIVNESVPRSVNIDWILRQGGVVVSAAPRRVKTRLNVPSEPRSAV